MQQYVDDRLAAAEERRAFEHATKLPEHGDEITNEVLRLSSQLVKFREAGATLEAQLSRMSKEVAKLTQMSEAVDKLPVFGEYVETRFTQVEEQVTQELSRLKRQVDMRIARVRDQVEDEVSRMGAQVEEAISRVQAESLERLGLLGETLEARRNAMLQDIEQSAECVLRELRQEISRGRVSDVTGDGAMAHMARAGDLFRAWWGMAMTGNTVIHRLVRNVWRQ